ncbi:MAG: hypothetical protein H7326_09450 [Bdellovibrionaceae bacterium]|nr:hypothetical protein [Pseudobdellovibrionaceae bacterium]
MGRVLDFFFGKDPDIFDEKGNVSHKLPKKKWDSWHNRTKTDPEYNWRNHTGAAGTRKKTNQDTSNR